MQQQRSRSRLATIAILLGLASLVAGGIAMFMLGVSPTNLSPRSITSEDAKSLNPVRRIPGQYKKHLETREARVNRRIKESVSAPKQAPTSAWKGRSVQGWSGPGVREEKAAEQRNGPVNPTPARRDVDDPNAHKPLKINVIRR